MVFAVWIINATPVFFATQALFQDIVFIEKYSISATGRNNMAFLLYISVSYIVCGICRAHAGF
jgi:hypothetical protein